MFCKNCGNELQEYAHFCAQCGQPVDNKQDFPVDKKQDFDEIGAVLKKILNIITNKKLLIGAAVIVLIILGSIVMKEAFSLEKKLMGTVWWTEPKFYNEAYDYSDSSWFQEEHPNSPTVGYYVQGECQSFLFCEYGTIRKNWYQTPYYSGCSYMSSREVDSSNYSGDYQWGMGSSNDTTWSLLDGKKLSIGDEVYEWDSGEDEDTWYMTSDVLRIGEVYYYAKEPRIYDVDGLPPYWCAYCGKEGPFSNKCPQCESTEKTQ